MKRIIIAFTLIAGYLLCYSDALGRSQSSQREIFANAATNTLMMLNPENPGSGGTGFVVQLKNGNKYTVTNAHVCALSDKPYMMARQGEQYLRLQIIDISDDADLCLLQAYPNKEGLRMAESLSRYQGVYVVGHPRLEPIAMTAGWVRTREMAAVSYCGLVGRLSIKPSFIKSITAENCVLSRDSIMTNAPSRPGNSGSAVLDDFGEVVGVLYAGDPDYTSLLVPLEELKTFLSQY